MIQNSFLIQKIIQTYQGQVSVKRPHLACAGVTAELGIDLFSSKQETVPILGDASIHKLQIRKKEKR